MSDFAVTEDDVRAMVEAATGRKMEPARLARMQTMVADVNARVAQGAALHLVFDTTPWSFASFAVTTKRDA